MRLRFLLTIVAVATSVSAQERPNGAPTSPIPALIRQMPGTWRVEQRMWTDTGTTPLVLPAAIARRRLVEGSFLEEIIARALRRQHVCGAAVGRREERRIQGPVDHWPCRKGSSGGPAVSHAGTSRTQRRVSRIRVRLHSRKIMIHCMPLTLLRGDMRIAGLLFRNTINPTLGSRPRR